MLRLYQPGGRPHFARIDSLRGLGALSVAVFHISGWEHAGEPILAVPSAWVPAHAALMVFFVISGFVLRVALEHGRQEVRAAIGKFLVARAFRVFPIVAFGLLLAAIWPCCRYDTLPVDDWNIGNWLASLLLLDVTWNPTLWALQVELLMVPAILCMYFAERRWGASVPRIIAFLGTFLAFSNWIGWQPLSANFFSFALGMAVPTWGLHLARKLSTMAANIVTLSLVITVALTSPLLGTYSLYSTILEAYSAFALVSFAAYRQDLWLTRLLDFKPLQSIGLTAGSIYVLHMATIKPTLLLAESLAFPASLVIILWLTLLIPIGRLTYLAVEAPGMAAGRRLTRWWLTAEAASPTKLRLRPAA